ncbi:MAG TPA: response regulator [Devosiaceae bacterium]|jgi:CheY-like chemotaxis protein|nr:response regulator [Devosiaceae bacterium]
MELEGLRVLLVEDESLVAMAVEDMLHDLGCEVAATAGSVPEALERLQVGGFDFALLDVNLANQQVFPVAEALSEQRIPFAFASGYGAANLPEAFRARPVAAKPFQIADLAATLSAALAAER